MHHPFWAASARHLEALHAHWPSACNPPAAARTTDATPASPVFQDHAPPLPLPVPALQRSTGCSCWVPWWSWRPSRRAPPSATLTVRGDTHRLDGAATAPPTQAGASAAAEKRASCRCPAALLCPRACRPGGGVRHAAGHLPPSSRTAGRLAVAACRRRCLLALLHRGDGWVRATCASGRQPAALPPHQSSARLRCQLTKQACICPPLLQAPSSPRASPRSRPEPGSRWRSPSSCRSWRACGTGARRRSWGQSRRAGCCCEICWRWRRTRRPTR